MVYGIGTAIPANSDLNDYVTPGNYYSMDTANTSTLKNIPPSVTTGFRMNVVAVSNSMWIKQIILVNENIQRIRMRAISAGDIGKWYVSVFSEDS